MAQSMKQAKESTIVRGVGPGRGLLLVCDGGVTQIQYIFEKPKNILN